MQVGEGLGEGGAFGQPGNVISEHG
jgi:hypothetical protein